MLFWSNVNTWISNTKEVSINFTILEILLGITLNNSHSILCNYIILYGKKFIYDCKSNQREIFFLEFLRTIRSKLNVERLISVKNNVLADFDNIFGEMYDSF